MAGYPSPAELAGAPWQPLLPRSALRGDTRNEFDVDSRYRFTHVRLGIEPDGGVARLRVHGEVVPDPALLPGRTWELAGLAGGGLVIDCSDRFYGAPGNLIAPGQARTMGEGWETARRRDSGNDWVLVRLAAPGRIRLVELDTSHFKGNAPAAAALRGADPRADPSDWFEILPRTRLQPDTVHRFPVRVTRPAALVRLDIFPDGGLARLRLYGKVSRADRAALAHRLRECTPPEARHQPAPPRPAS
jgi:allantoicase